MPRAKLTIFIPNGVWIGDLSRDYPEARFRVLAAIPDPDEEIGVGLIEVTAPDLGSVLMDMDSYEAVASLDVLHHHDDEAIVQFETTMPLLLFPVRSSGVPLEMPFDIQGGEAVWEITASQDRLSTLGEQLETFGIRYNVEHIYQHFESGRILTDRQRRLVNAAIEHGYYDTPRTCSLTELADELDRAKSTVSESLHRAEEAIIKDFAERELGETTSTDAAVR